MTALNFALFIFYAAVLGVTVALARAMLVHRIAARPVNATLVCLACFFGGPAMASLATPDWSPVSLVALVAPFWLLGAFFAVLARRRSHA